MTDLQIDNVRPMGGTVGTLHIKDGYVVDTPVPGAAALDGGGALALPAFIDAHMHLDKTLWGLPWRPHSAGKSLSEKNRK